MPSEADLKVLLAQDDATLAEWYCLLNRWGWPALLAPEERDGPGDVLARPRSLVECVGGRRMDIMWWIANRVGEKLVSRTWNKDMTDEEFDDFWRGTYEGDIAAKQRYWARLEEKAKAAQARLQGP